MAIKKHLPHAAGLLVIFFILFLFIMDCRATRAEAPYIQDNAYILTNEETAQIMVLCAEMEERTGGSLFVVTVGKELEGTLKNYTQAAFTHLRLGARDAVLVYDVPNGQLHLTAGFLHPTRKEDASDILNAAYQNRLFGEGTIALLTEYYGQRDE